LDASRPDGDNRVVLLVDRDSAARELAAHFLREVGFLVELAADGESAWQRTQKLHPDVVVSEILVPRLDGLALCRRIKGDSETKDIPVLMLSILAATARAKDAGADGFLAKPISQGRLASAVSGLMPLRAANEERP